MHYVFLPVAKEGVAGSQAGMGDCERLGRVCQWVLGKRSHEVGSPVLALGQPHRRSPLRLWVSWDRGGADMGTLQEVAEQRSGFSFPHHCALATPTPPRLLPEHPYGFSSSGSPIPAEQVLKWSQGHPGYVQLPFSPCS